MIVLASLVFALVAADPGAAVPLTQADEDGFFDLDRPYAAGRDTISAHDMLAAPDKAADCRSSTDLAAYDRREMAALTGYLDGLQSGGKTVDALLGVYLAQADGAAHDAATQSLDCAYAPGIDDLTALQRHVETLIGMLPEPMPGRGLDVMTNIVTREVYLDEIVLSLGQLKDAGGQSPEAQALIARLPELRQQAQYAHLARVVRLGDYEHSAAGDAVMARQVKRSER